MKQLELKYGCNPNQKPANLHMHDGSDLPIQVLNGKPGYINFLDAFNSWQLVRELKEATGLPAAASFKHVSPAGAAVGHPLSDTDRAMYFVEEEGELSPIACAYIRARGADRLCSYGDWAALSDVCDADVARYLAKEVSDGIIAPGYTDEALEILKTKRKGSFNVVQIDPAYVPAETELKDVFGITFEQGHNNFRIDRELLRGLSADWALSLRNRALDEDGNPDEALDSDASSTVRAIPAHQQTLTPAPFAADNAFSYYLNEGAGSTVADEDVAPDGMIVVADRYQEGTSLPENSVLVGEGSRFTRYDLAAAVRVDHWDAGLVEVPRSTVTGRVWQDEDYDGIQSFEAEVDEDGNEVTDAEGNPCLLYTSDAADD